MNPNRVPSLPLVPCLVLLYIFDALRRNLLSASLSSTFSPRGEFHAVVIFIAKGSNGWGSLSLLAGVPLQANFIGGHDLFDY